MAERKYTGTDAELLRMKREGLSLRAIAADVGIGKSVVGARIARAEEAERRGAESRASTQADGDGLPEAATASSRGALATTSSDPHAAGPINIRAELEAIARDPKTPSREKLAALKELARSDAEQSAPSASVRLTPPGSLAISRHRDGTFSLWIRKPNGWVQEPNLAREVVFTFIAATLFPEVAAELLQGTEPVLATDAEPEP